MYKLEPSQHDKLLFFRLDGEAAERHGTIGYLRADFGRDGREFYSTWFDGQPRLKTPAFKDEFDAVINSLRDDGEKPPFASRNNLAAFMSSAPGKELEMRGGGYAVQTLDYSYYFRCCPRVGDYDIYCHTFDNRWLLPELAGKHDLPDACFSILPSSGELILIKPVEKRYFPADLSTANRLANRGIADAQNELLGVTKGQEAACLAGSMFGWGTPAACPWKYDQEGRPRPQQPQRKEPER